MDEITAKTTAAASTLAEIMPLPGGFTLYRQENGVGGHIYLSDSIQGGVVVWDTCLVTQTELLAALSCESQRREAEQRDEVERRRIQPAPPVQPKAPLAVALEDWMVEQREAVLRAFGKAPPKAESEMEKL